MQKSYRKNYYNEGDHLTLDANEVHFSVDDESKALLPGVDKESKEVVQCDKLVFEGTNKDPADSPGCSTVNGDTVTQENAVKEVKPDMEGSNQSTQVPQNTRHDSVQHEEDFIAKDLLGFAWQVARGMVSTYGRALE